jgi:GNAT superfamily N-acetyltransferase
VIHIRAAVPEDAYAMAELRWEFRAARAPAIEPQGAFLARCHDWMRRELTTCSMWHAWVAVANERIVGQVWIALMPKLPNPIEERESHAYLSNLYVKPEHRGGVGARLLKTALAWAVAQEVDRVLLWPSAQSVSLYERHGFTHHGDVMELTC